MDIGDYVISKLVSRQNRINRSNKKVFSMKFTTKVSV